MNRSLTAVLLGTTALVWTNVSAFSQDAQPASSLPDVVVEQPSAKPKVAAKAKPKKPKSAPAQTQSEPANSGASPPLGESYEPVIASGLGASGGTSGPVAPGTRSGSLTVPTTAEAKADIETTPGGVDLVASDEYAKSTPAVTLKDALDYVPGVFVQPKWGEDARLSIRGSGLSRNFHGRGVTLLMDGVIPITTADGGSDFQEIDPSAYRFIEVYKGGNALRYGANSLGGAINFVIPTGYDADLFGVRLDIGSFGFHKLAVSSGAVAGAADYFITGSWQEQDGFRDHSSGESQRVSANIGYRLTEDVETRFYINANHIRQNIPGAVTRNNALTNPEGAFVLDGLGTTGFGNDNVDRDYERNLDTLRFANKTTLRVAPGTLMEFGGFYMDRHLDHPIFQVLDNQHEEYGGFARLVSETDVAGYRNRLTAGLNIHNGEIHARNFNNVLGERGALVNDQIQESRNTVLYAENALYVTPALAFIAGVQWSDIERRLDDRLISVVNGNLVDESRQGDFTSWSPKGGFTYDYAPGVQIFGNVSKSSEAPTFGEIRFPGQVISNEALGTLDEQEAVTYEIGTRGSLPGISWDLALYRSNLDGEFQCQVARGAPVNGNPGPIIPGSCNQINLDKTIHQGVELGLAFRLLQGIFEHHGSQDEVWLNSAYTFSDFRFDGDAEFGNNELPGAPRHFVRAELLYKHSSGIYFGPNVEWVPEAFYVDSANTLETENYALLGLKLGFDNGGKISAYIEGRNLTDEAYIASASIAHTAAETDALFEPGTGRAVYGGVRVKW